MIRKSCHYPLSIVVITITITITIIIRAYIDITTRSRCFSSASICSRRSPSPCKETACISCQEREACHAHAVMHISCKWRLRWMDLEKTDF